MLQGKADEVRLSMIERGEVITASGFRDFLSVAKQRKWQLMILFKIHNDDLKARIGKGVAKGTWTNFDTSYKHLSNF